MAEAAALKTLNRQAITGAIRRSLELSWGQSKIPVECEVIPDERDGWVFVLVRETIDDTPVVDRFKVALNAKNPPPG